MDMIYLSRVDVESLDVSMREVLAAVNLGLAAKGMGNAEMPPKPGIHTSWIASYTRCWPLNWRKRAFVSRYL